MPDYFAIEPGKSLVAASGTYYKSIQILGVGGNSATFLAYATSGPAKGVLFAIKGFRKLSRPERTEAFLNEQKFLKTCEHPAIMRVFDEGTYYERPFLVAEYLPRTLRHVIRSGARMVEKVSYALQLLSALSYLADQDPPTVHRDIKPENIFIKDQSCVLGDFGLMKRLRGSDDEDRQILRESVGPGMPFYYRTPDLVAYLKGEPNLTPRSDVFQLGLVLAELFTGRNPERRAQDFADAVELEPLGQIPGALAGGIAALIKRMLVEEPEEREDAGQLMDAWRGVFEEAVERARDLEGRAFW